MFAGYIALAPYRTKSERIDSDVVSALSWSFIRTRALGATLRFVLCSWTIIESLIVQPRMAQNRFAHGHVRQAEKTVLCGVTKIQP